MHAGGSRAIVAAMIRWGAAAYAILSLAVCIGSWLWLDRLPIAHPEPVLTLGPVTAHIYSVLLGGALGACLVISSRLSVARFSWARRLHNEFRPVARQLSSTGIVALALMSGIGEELLFRGLLQPYVGLIAQAVIFGLLHQLPGRSRWVWVAWAAAVGLLLGAVFELTGSIIGPIVAHAMVNGLNLAYLKHHDLQATQTPLGGLLGGGASSSGGARHP